MRRLAVLLLTVAAPAARAAPIEGSGRVIVSLGWRYTPNDTFADQATRNGLPLSGTRIGGPGGMASFAYQWSADMEIGLEVGCNVEQFSMVNYPNLLLTQVPLLASLRWWFASFSFVSFYVGGGAGMLLNFWTAGPGNYGEAHTPTPLVLVGAMFPINDTFGIVVEDRQTLARSLAENVGMAQVGGNMLTIGVQYTFPPEKKKPLF